MATMLGGLTSGKGQVGALKSRRAMLDTLVKHLDMVRLSTSALAALALAASACSGLIDESGGEDQSLTPEEVAARQAYVQNAKPVLDSFCASCHSGSDPSVDFMAGGTAMEQRNALMTFDPQVVNLEAPGSSRVLTKGAHSGPALTASQASEILAWITAERTAANVTGGEMGLETARFNALLCTSGQPGDATCPYNYVDIAPLVEGWAGARIAFIATPLSQDLYVTNLALESGSEGVYLEHPLFVSWPAQGDPIPDTLDRFFNVKLNMMAGATPEIIGGGTAAFVNFTPTNQLSIHFKVVDRYRADAGGGGGGGGGGDTGCKELALFKSAAQPQLQNNCASCHANAGNGNARSAMDITGINNTGDDTVMKTVCDQTRTRINFQTTDMSGLYIAPNPGAATGHDFKFGTPAAFDAFKAALDPWVQAEKTAQ